jgi:hypothetical protein
LVVLSYVPLVIVVTCSGKQSDRELNRMEITPRLRDRQAKF